MCSVHRWCGSVSWHLPFSPRTCGYLSVPVSCLHPCSISVFRDWLCHSPFIVIFKKLCRLFSYIYSFVTDFRVSLSGSILWSLDAETVDGHIQQVSEGWTFEVISDKQAGLWLCKSIHLPPQRSWPSYFCFLLHVECFWGDICAGLPAALLLLGSHQCLLRRRALMQLIPVLARRQI